MNTTDISNTEAFTSTLHEQAWVVADFWAGWCGPCRAMAPAFERVAANGKQSFTAVKVDIDRHPDLARQHRIRSIPTLVLFHRGIPVDQLIGSHTEREIGHWIGSHLDAAAGDPHQHKLSLAD